MTAVPPVPVDPVVLTRTRDALAAAAIVAADQLGVPMNEATMRRMLTELDRCDTHTEKVAAMRRMRDTARRRQTIHSVKGGAG